MKLFFFCSLNGKTTINTKEVATVTMDKLHTQGEQIQRVQGNIDTMSNHFDKADHEMKSINSVWGQLGNSITGYKQKEYNTNTKVQEKEDKKRAKFDKEMEKGKKVQAKEDKKKEKELAKRGVGASNNVLPEELGILSKQTQTEVLETNQMLDEIGSHLGDLKTMALEMGNEIQVQNDRLDVLKTSVDKTDARLAATNHKVRKAL